MHFGPLPFSHSTSLPDHSKQSSVRRSVSQSVTNVDSQALANLLFSNRVESNQTRDSTRSYGGRLVGLSVGWSVDLLEIFLKFKLLLSFYGIKQTVSC